MAQNGPGRDYRSYSLVILYIAVTAAVAQLINEIVAEPYLDEIFHVPQAQRYCQGQFKGYDPKLTTPPGLYVISLVLGRLKGWISSWLPAIFERGEACHQVPHLRMTSLLAVLCLPWCLKMYSDSVEHHMTETDLHAKGDARWHRTIVPVSPLEAITKADANPQQAGQEARRAVAVRHAQVRSRRRRGLTGFISNSLDDHTSMLNALVVSILPPMWFFGFLYYTDISSTLFVLLLLSAAKRQKHILAALFGAISLTLRQTNIVWILFAIGIAVLDRLSPLGLNTAPLEQSTIGEQLKSLSNVLVSTTAFREIFFVIVPYGPVFAASAAFIYYNGSIVLGDKEHHQVSTHWVQPFYFAAFAVMFAWPSLLHVIRRRTLSSILNAKGVAGLLLLTALSLLAVRFGTVAHPFLLADNRHYAFYIWRKVIARTQWSRFVLALAYAVSAKAWWIALSQKHSFFWLVGFILCLCAAVIPSPLIEPRYFMIPYVIVRLSLLQQTEAEKSQQQAHVVRDVPSDTRNRDSDVRPLIANKFGIACWVEGAWAVGINFAALYLFLYRPFRWSDSSAWQRFMW